MWTLIYKKNIFFSSFLIYFFYGVLFSQESNNFKAVAVGFYNVENLFSLENDPFTVYHDRSLRSESFYTKEIYNAKLKNISEVISNIGRNETKKAPVIVGLCEVENRQVVEDLINQDVLAKEDYGIVHYNSPDRRGIDVAFIYKKSAFIVTHSHSRELVLYSDINPLQRIYTRNQLVVSGILDGEPVHFIVNHWPSRSGGKEKTEANRIKAGQLNRKIVDSLFAIDPYAKIVNMGDFNDDPVDKSIKQILQTSTEKKELLPGKLYNPFEKIFKNGIGTLAYRDRWNLFDQILLSKSFLTKKYSGLQYLKAGVYNPSYLVNAKGKFKGYPYRAYAEGGFTGGYSDHFPVYVLLIKK